MQQTEGKMGGMGRRREQKQSVWERSDKKKKKSSFRTKDVVIYPVISCPTVRMHRCVVEEDRQLTEKGYRQRSV